MTALISRTPLFGPFLAALMVALPVAAAHAATLAPSNQTLPTGLDPTAQHAPMPKEGILVLRGGQVIRGKISRSGDRYHVALTHGEILIRAVEVESCCRTLDEAYRLKRSFMHLGDVYGHIALAEWCLQNNLLDAAAAEVADAAAADPKNPMVAHLRRRLKAELNPPPLRKAPPASMQAMPSRSELDQLSKAMPSGTLEMFTDTIQPLLLNSCSTHDCHGPRAQSRFRLLRAHAGRAPSRRLTQRNLHAVMQWVDRKNPAASPLLTKPIQPHGPKNIEIFNDTNVDRYRRLVNWVGSVVQHHKVQSLRRPAVANRKAGSRAGDVPATINGVQQASHATPLPDASRPASRLPGVNRAVFEAPLPRQQDGKKGPPGE